MEVEVEIKEVVDKLNEEIKGNNREDLISKFEETLSENIEELSKNEQLFNFFNLPLSNIFSVISKADFNVIEDSDEVIEIIRNIINKIVTAHSEEKETLLILQYINIPNENSITYDQIISTLGLIKNCPILVKLCDLNKKQEQLPNKDYDHDLKEKEQEIEKLKQEIEKLNKETKNLKHENEKINQENEGLKQKIQEIRKSPSKLGDNNFWEIPIPKITIAQLNGATKQIKNVFISTYKFTQSRIQTNKNNNKDDEMHLKDLSPPSYQKEENDDSLHDSSGAIQL